MFGRKDERIEETVAADAAVSGDEADAAEPTEEQEESEGGSATAELESDESTDGQDSLDDPAQRMAEELELASDRHLRLAAEFENFRKRTRREQAELSVVAQADLARRLLPTLDDLARVSSTPPETTTVEALDAGLDLILRNLRKELEDAGLTRIEAMGERFNPELHQGLMTADTPDRELDDTISRVFVDGYVFRERLVRPAQVEVLTYSPEGVEDQ